MVDSWITKRDTETDFSNRSRIAPIIGFLKFINSRGWIDFEIPELPKVKSKKPIPHAFTEDELKNFFLACDELEDGSTLNVTEKNRGSCILPTSFQQRNKNNGRQTSTV